MITDTAPTPKNSVLYATHYEGHGCINFNDGSSLSGCMSPTEVQSRADGAPCFDLQDTSITTLTRENPTPSQLLERLIADADTAEI
jgi:hypothetical protein